MHVYEIPQLLYYTLFRTEGVVSLSVTPYTERGLPALVRLLPSIHTLGRIFAMYICSYTRIATSYTIESKQTRYS